jgi:DNA-binding response OmpR family regulator
MNMKALVIEDDVNIAELLRIYLEKEGFTVQTAADGAAGAEAVGAFAPDIVLLDIMLPVMDGWAVCKAIRKTSSVPIIMLTAKGETVEQGEGPGDGGRRLYNQAL